MKVVLRYHRRKSKAPWRIRTTGAPEWAGWIALAARIPRSRAHLRDELTTSLILRLAAESARRMNDQAIADRALHERNPGTGMLKTSGKLFQLAERLTLWENAHL